MFLSCYDLSQKNCATASSRIYAALGKTLGPLFYKDIKDLYKTKVLLSEWLAFPVQTDCLKILLFTLLVAEYLN